MHATLGLKARTGRAILVAVAGEAPELKLVERSQMPLLPQGDWAPYHAAEDLEPEAADESVKRSIASARYLATRGIGEAVQRITGAGYDVSGCAVLVGTGMPKWTTAEILAVHFRMHKAEGELFRDVLMTGALACGLRLVTLPEKTALESAAEVAGLSLAHLDAQLKMLGKFAGPPWGKDQKEAAAAALAALKQVSSSCRSQ